MADADEKMRNGAGEEDVLFKLKYFNLSRFISYQCIKNSEMFCLNEYHEKLPLNINLQRIWVTAVVFLQAQGTTK